MSSSKFKNNQGFTLVEVLISMVIIVIGTVGAFLAIQGAITQTTLSSSQSIAAYLAQEGIEIVRNIRDTNYIRHRSWDEGIPEGNCLEADYTSNGLSSCGSQPRYLSVNGQGFYNYSSGTTTQFKRKIGIEKPDDNEMRVTVTIEWQEKGKNYQIVLKGNINNTRKTL